jgi:hypothetical protein
MPLPSSKPAPTALDDSGGAGEAGLVAKVIDRLDAGAVGAHEVLEAEVGELLRRPIAMMDQRKPGTAYPDNDRQVGGLDKTRRTIAIVE